MPERENSLLAWVGTGIVFALMMQVAPFRWAVYALTAWLGFLFVQDWWSEHELPAGSAEAEWQIEAQDLQSNASDQHLRYSIGSWIREADSQHGHLRSNHGSGLMTNDQIALGAAMMLLRRHGDQAPTKVAARIGELAVEGDWEGLTFWKTVASKMDQILRAGSVQ